MPNRFIPIKELEKELGQLFKKVAGSDTKKQRTLWYDLQTIFGGFTASASERKRFIRTGTCILGRRDNRKAYIALPRR